MSSIYNSPARNEISKANRIILTVFGIVWFSFLVLEIFGTFFISEDKHPVFFRAWEAVSNLEGKDANFAPFKPHFTYDGPLVGDLLKPLHLEALNSEKRHQLFIVDEYGFRNQPYLLRDPLDAVVIGSSFVTGAAFSQEDLISTLLTEKYGIRTYNYYGSLQTFWEDTKFQKNVPKVVVYLGSEGELINSYWKFQIENRVPIFQSTAWNSYEEWQKANISFPKTFEKLSAHLYNYSILRVFANKTHTKLVNFGRNRETIAKFSSQSMVEYDHESKMLFWQPAYDNPVLGSDGKKQEDIEKAVKILNETHLTLNSRGIVFITAAMPSKTHAELSTYKSLPDNQRALVYFNKMSSEKGKYINEDLYSLFKDRIIDPKQSVYFSDDSHWNIESNYLIAEKLSQSICFYLPKKHQCRDKISTASGHAFIIEK